MFYHKGFFKFRDYNGIQRVAIISTIVMRESISYSKLPEPSTKNSTFRIPLGIPVSMPAPRTQAEKDKTDKKSTTDDKDKLSASGSEEDEDEKFLNDDTFLKEQQTERLEKLEAFRHISCLMELNMYDIWVSRHTLSVDKKQN